MLLKQERIDAVKHSEKMLAYGLTKGTGGNISIINRGKDLVLYLLEKSNYLLYNKK